MKTATLSVEPLPILSSVDGGVKRGARLSQSGGVKDPHAVDEIGLRYNTKVVETCGALCRRPVVGTERYLGRDVPNGPRHRGCKYAIEHGDRC